MNFIKRQWILVTVILVTVIVNGILGFLIFTTSDQVEKAEAELENQRNKVKDTISFQQKKYGLTAANKEKAAKNKQQAWENYDQAFKALQSKFGVAKYDPNYAETPFAAKGFIENRCESMTQDLESRGVALGGSVKAFTFTDLIGKGDLPPKENVEFIIRNMLIVDDIFKILYQSDLKGINRFERPELKLKEHEGGIYKYMPFTLTIEGSYGAIRKFVKRLNDSETAGFLYIIRNIDMKTSELLSTLGQNKPGATGIDGKPSEGATTTSGKSKSERIVLRDMAIVTATIDFDYVEILKKTQ